MNFDDMKSAWRAARPENIDTPVLITSLKTAQLPINQLRKKMKQEFSVQALTIVFIGFIPLLLHFSPAFLLPFYTLYVVFLAICGYYLGKLYLFYKRLTTNTLNTRDSLYETYYEIRLHIEVYKSFTYSLFPFAIFVLLMALMNMKEGKLMQLIMTGSMSGKNWIPLAVVLLPFIAGVMVVTETWANRQYGQYARQLRKLLDQLKEEEEQQ